jgi:hypothetical protein
MKTNIYKDKILKLKSEGKSYRQIAKELKCGRSTVGYWLNPKQREKDLNRSRKRRTNKYEFFRRVKSIYGCVDCGNKDWRVLEFDHVNREDKKNSISRLIANNANIKTLKKEVKKCVIRCANCHRIKTFNNKDWELV